MYIFMYIFYVYLMYNLMYFYLSKTRFNVYCCIEWQSSL